LALGQAVLEQAREELVEAVSSEEGFAEDDHQRHAAMTGWNCTLAFSCQTASTFSGFFWMKRMASS
jgi:hypothetical protein